MTDTIICARCKCRMSTNEYFRNGKQFKTCNKCYTNRKVKRNLHSKEKITKYTHTLDHKIRTEGHTLTAKQYKISEDIRNLRIKYITYICKEHDLKNNLDINDIIDESFILELISNQQNKRIHCQSELLYDCKANDSCLAIMERKNCNIGHTKNNCQLTCFKCTTFEKKNKQEN